MARKNKLQRLALIDIGSNTVLLTLGERATSGSLNILADLYDVARLAEGLKDGGLLQVSAKQRVLNCLKEMKKSAIDRGATSFLAAGTAAFRRARDGKDFAQEIEKEIGIPVRILTGEEEAYYSYLSAEQDFAGQYPTLGMIDIGGGSTELVFGKQGPRYSLPVGTVRLAEQFQVRHPISDNTWRDLKKSIAEILKANLDFILPMSSYVIPASSYVIPAKAGIQSEKKALDPRVKPEDDKKVDSEGKAWIAVAATPASLASLDLSLPRYDPTLVHGHKMTLDNLKNLIEKLRRLSVEDRQKLPGMEAKRAELLPLGGLILEICLEYLGASEVVASDHGLRYGLLAETLSRL